MDPPSVERLLAAFDAPDPPRDGRPPGLAAVLLTLYDTPEGPSLLYTRRSESMRSHPGEVSFPGGRVDPEDDGPLQAALREAHEEVGLRADRVDTPRHLVDFQTFRGSIVCAYVARSLDAEPPTEPTSPDEVAEVFTVPLRTLLDPARYEARRVSGMERGRRVHYWQVPPRVIWGITGELTAQFLQRAVGWTPPDNVRTIQSIDDFVPRRR